MSISGMFVQREEALLSKLRPSLAGAKQEISPEAKTWRNGWMLLGCMGGAALATSIPSANTVVVLDGRIDNRDELRHTLGACENFSDAALVALAYERWGEDFLNHLIGDYACGVCDENKRQLFLARDPSGMRPLHFYASSGVLFFASEPQEVITASQVPRALNEQHLAEWLTILPHESITSTFYQRIERIPSGHVLIVCRDGIRLHRYWQPEKLSLLHFRRYDDYADALLSTLDRAVHSRVPTSGAVGSLLSAGLDSSSVSALAARLLSDQGRRLTAFTAVPRCSVDELLYPGRICDEGPLAAMVARDFQNIDHILVHNDTSPVVDALERFILAADEPLRNVSNIAWFDAILTEAQRRGISVLLGGAMGNMTITGC